MLGKVAAAQEARGGSWPLLALGLLLLASSARADVPFPTCEAAGCQDPSDFGAYLFIQPGALPNDFDPSSGEAWKYQAETGMDAVGVWERTTGRPDVVIAVLDSGIIWEHADLAGKVAPNAGELPIPPGCASHDCNGDGFVSVHDFAEACAADPNGNGHCDGQDLIRFYANGVDDDANGYVDDIAGWDFADDDNDAEDLVRYGHGTGEASDEVSEANNGSGFPGFAPSALFLPLRVADSFVGLDSEFAQAVVYAADRGVTVISEALGTVSASPSGQAAVDYAVRQGIPIIASAADEQSRHHNTPALYEHVIWVNSVRNGDGTILDSDANGFDVLNGCTNYGGKAWVAIPSSACSSEATSRAGGLVALLVSHARNRVDAGLLAPHPRTGTPLSAEEVRQLMRVAARDVDHADDASVVLTVLGSVFETVLSAPLEDLFYGSSRFPTQAGWDQFTGYGRPDGRRLLDLVDQGAIPPEVDLSGSLRWFDLLDPVRAPEVDVVASVAAVRAGDEFDWQLEVGCGVQPLAFEVLATGSETSALVGATLSRWEPGETAEQCGFDPTRAVESPDEHTVTVRLRARDRWGNLGEDRRTVAIHHDATLRFVRSLGGSGEPSPVLADVDRDGVLDILQGGGDGRVLVVDGATGSDLPGFPARTRALPVHDSAAYASGAVPVPHESIVGALAADDLEADGRVEIVASSVHGRLYVFDDHGRLRSGFPVSVDPALSRPENRDRLNDTEPRLVSAPTLVDLDPPGLEPTLELVASALDGHLYAWRADGSSVAGFPVRLADPAKVSVDPATGKATPLPGVPVNERGAKVLSSPAAGDLDGDGRPELVVGTNEEYPEDGLTFVIESAVLRALAQFGVDDLEFDTASRVYAVRPDGNAHPAGPFLPGWPVAVPILAPGVLPTVGTGTPASPALADVREHGRVVAIASAAGPVMLLRPDGSSALGSVQGLPRPMALDFPDGGFPTIPPEAGSPDAPFFAAFGSGAFGDLDGDGEPEYVAPTGGLRQFLDILVSGAQGRLVDETSAVTEGMADHQVTAWDPGDGSLLPAFPRPMDDIQFIASPMLGDVDGDGRAEIVEGSGAYLVRAYRLDGSTPVGWPKFTHGWHVGSPAAGDVDGDGRVEVVAATREGRLFVWETPAGASQRGLPWSGFGRDRRNTQNLASGVSPLAPPRESLDGLTWTLEAIAIELENHEGPAAARSLTRNALRAIERGKTQPLSGLLRALDHQLARLAASDPALATLSARLSVPSARPAPPKRGRRRK
jgi:hypothetical protein